MCTHAQLCPSLCNPTDGSLPGSSVHGNSQVRTLEWVAISFSRWSSWSRDQTHISCIAGGFFSDWATREILSVDVLVTQSCPSLCDPMDCSPPGFSVHGILQVSILEWIAIPFSRGSSQPRDRTLVSCIPGRFFTVWATGKPCATVGGPWPRWSLETGHMRSLTHMLKQNKRICAEPRIREDDPSKVARSGMVVWAPCLSVRRCSRPKAPSHVAEQGLKDCAHKQASPTVSCVHEECNSHLIQFTHSDYTTPCYLIYSHSCANHYH